MTTFAISAQHLLTGYSLPLSLLLFFLFLLLLKTKLRSAKTHLPPSPPKLPLLGNLHQLGPLPHRSLSALADKHGPLMLLHLGTVPALVVSSADAAREVLKTHDLIFANRPSSIASTILLYGNADVAFAPYGQHWKNARKLCAAHLLSPKMVHSFRRLREDQVSSMIANIARQSSEAVNMSEVLYSYANDIICRAVSRKVLEVEGRNELFRELTDAFIDVVGAHPVGDFFPVLSWLDSRFGIGAKARRSHKRWDDVLTNLIDAHENTAGDGHDDEAEDFVDVLLSLREEYALTRVQIKALLVDMFAAGSVPSSVFLEWAMAELVRNPQIMKKLQEEVRGVAGTRTMVTEDDLEKMSYLKAVLKEALRLHPPHPLLVPRESMDKCRVSGYDIPSKTRVFINFWASSRKIWEAPDEFRPERFVNNPVDFKGNDFEFIPFGAGRRICPGMNFGISASELAVANLVHRFDWELPYGMKELDMSERPGFNVAKKESLYLLPKLHSNPV